MQYNLLHSNTRKTIFARYQDISEGGLDEDGMGINNVEKSLDRVGIKIRENDTTFRAFGDVLDDLYGKWDSLTEVEQSNIAKSLAGVRQRENLLVLMENQALYQKLLTEQANSEGLAMDRYATYLEGVEAAQNRVQASWEALYMGFVKSGSLTGIYNFTASILELINTLGGIKPIIMEVIALLIMFNGPAVVGAIKGLVVGLKNMKFMMDALRLGAMTTGEVMATAFGIAAVAITTAIMLYNVFSESAEEAAARVEKLSGEIDKLRGSIGRMQSNLKQVGELGKEFEELKNKATKNNKEQERFAELQNKIKEILPEVAGHYDELGNFIFDASVNLQTLIDLQKEQIKIEQEQLQLKLKDQIIEAADAYATQAKEIQNTQDAIARLQKASSSPIGLGGRVSKEDIVSKVSSLGEKLKQQSVDLEAAKNQFKQFYLSINEEGRKALREHLATMDEFGDALLKELDIVDEMQKIQEKSSYFGSRASYTDIISGTVEEYEGFLETLKNINKETSELNSLLAKSKTDGLDSEDVQKLLEANEDYIDMLDIVGDKIVLNEKKVNDYNLRLLTEAKSHLSAAEAAGKQGQVLDYLISQIGKGIDMSKDIQAAYDDILDIIIDKIKFQKDAEKELLQDRIDGLKDALEAEKETIEEAIDAYRERVEAEKELIEESLDALDKKHDAEKDALQEQLDDLDKVRDSRREALEEELEVLEEAQEAEKERLDEEYKAYKRSIDIRLKALDLAKEERDFQDELAEKQKSLADIQNELAELQFDDSEEAMARRLELQDELAKKTKELERFQQDHADDEAKTAIEEELETFERLHEIRMKALEDEYVAQKKISEEKQDIIDDEYDSQREAIEASIKTLDEQYERQKQLFESRMEMLDDEFDKYEKNQQARLKLLEEEYEKNEGLIQDQIDAIDDYLAQTGTIVNDAIEQFRNAGEGYYQDLINWNSIYGSGIDSDITDKWYLAKQAVNDYIDAVNSVPSDIGGVVDSGESKPGTTPAPAPTHHSGVKAGWVGNKKPPIKEGEVFAKLMEGEIVVNPPQMENFVSKTLPEVVRNSNNNSSVVIDKLLDLTVQGNMDNSLLPDVQNIVNQAVERLGKIMLIRGKTRNVAAFS